jgi:hypothetical protein
VWQTTPTNAMQLLSPDLFAVYVAALNATASTAVERARRAATGQRDLSVVSQVWQRRRGFETYDYCVLVLVLYAKHIHV